MYGLTELARDQVATARLVANPGCYPTSVQLPLVPLIEVSSPPLPLNASRSCGSPPLPSRCVLFTWLAFPSRFVFVTCVVALHCAPLFLLVRPVHLACLPNPLARLFPINASFL